MPRIFFRRMFGFFRGVFLRRRYGFFGLALWAEVAVRAVTGLCDFARHPGPRSCYVFVFCRLACLHGEGFTSWVFRATHGLALVACHPGMLCGRERCTTAPAPSHATEQGERCAYRREFLHFLVDSEKLLVGLTSGETS